LLIFTKNKGLQQIYEYIIFAQIIINSNNNNKMKKKLILFSFLLPMALMAQNVQMHYDFGKGREYVTTTLEMFKTDKWGNTFFFVDYDYNLSSKKQVGLSYMEIARCFSFGKTSPLSAHIEYNGGLGALSSGSAYSINNAYLLGLDYGWHDKSFTKFLNFKVLYKNIIGKTNASFQLTGVWNLNFYKNKLTVSGFADFWKENNTNFVDASNNPLLIPTNTKYVFITEPQFWYNVTPHLSFGTEIEIASNFASVNGLKVCPTLAAKWNF
jgi:hypothetical protein